MHKHDKAWNVFNLLNQGNMLLAGLNIGTIKFLCCRESMSQEEHDKFWRTTQCTVEKDVVRTDRSHPYYEGDDNANIEILK